MSKIKKIYGIATNDADYPITKNEQIGDKYKRTWTCPYYRKWHNMLSRCYCEKYLKNYPSYESKIVCEEWLTFSNFKSWMEQQDWEGKHLDKDLLIESNILYSPDTCLFISEELNYFLVKPLKRGLDLPLGVVRYHRENLNGNTYVTYMADHGKTIYLGYYKDPITAHNSWKIEKLNRLLVLISKEKNLDILIGLNRIKVKLEHSIKNNTQIKNL